jgi:hypothetical protein
MGHLPGTNTPICSSFAAGLFSALGVAHFTVQRNIIRTQQDPLYRGWHDLRHLTPGLGDIHRGLQPHPPKYIDFLWSQE